MTPTTLNYQIGDEVSWTSQAGGFTKTKQGAIVEIVPAGQLPQTYVKDAGSKPRSDISYVVEVPQGKNGGKTYWPLTRNLQIVSRRAIAATALF